MVLLSILLALYSANGFLYESCQFIQSAFPVNFLVPFHHGRPSACLGPKNGERVVRRVVVKAKGILAVTIPERVAWLQYCAVSLGQHPTVFAMVWMIHEHIRIGGKAFTPSIQLNA